MKIKLLPSLLATAAILTGSCFAGEFIEEFNGKLNTFNWFHYKVGKGKLTPSGGVLNYVANAKTTASDYASIELLDIHPGYNENWEMSLDCSNTSNLGRNAGIGFQIFNHDDRNDRLFVEFYGIAGVSAGVFTNNNFTPAAKLSTKVGVAKGAIRVRFNKTTKLLTFYISFTQAEEGYQWKKIGTYSPTGSGGDVNAAWKMKPAKGEFGIQIFGFDRSKVVGAGKLTIDNFRVVTP